MAAHPGELRNRLEAAVVEFLAKQSSELQQHGELPNQKKSSHLMVTIKAPPNTARKEKPPVSVQKDQPVRQGKSAEFVHKEKSTESISQKKSTESIRHEKSAESLKSEASVATRPSTPIKKKLKVKKSESEAELRFVHRHGSGDFEEIDYHERPVLHQRIGSLLRKRVHTDVVFKVGKDQTPLEAHRLILSSASRVFEQLLYGEPCVLDIENEKMVLKEPEFTLVPFEVFLTAIYTNEVPIGLSLPMALEVFYAAKKYEVAFLQHKVMDHVSAAVSTVNVFEALSISTKLVELTSIIPACWKIIEEETKEVLEHHLETIEAHALGRILERDVLNLSEVELFQYLVRWAVVQCKKKGVKTTGRSKRQMMEPLLKYIRFTTLDADTMAELIIPARVLDTREISAIMSNINGPEHLKVPVPYKSLPRRIPFSKQPQFLPPAVTSVEGLFSELIMDYGAEPDLTPCVHKKKLAKKPKQKLKHVKRPPNSQR